MKKHDILHVSIDSSILRKDRGLNKTDLVYLKDLAKLKLIKLHFPWFVYKECTSTCVNEIVQQLDDAQRQLSNLAKKGLSQIDEIPYNKIKKTIEKEKKRVQGSVESVWKEFIAETDSRLHPFDTNKSASVFDSYFSGGAPFRSLKAREDIPDAFIFEEIREIAMKNELHFICGDNRLRVSSGSLENVSVYESFDEFFKSIVFEPAKLFYDGHGQTELKRLEFLTCLPAISNDLETDIEKWDWFDYYCDYPYSNDEFVTITSLYDITVDISNDDVKFIGSEFHINVLIRGKASLEYFVDKSVALWDDEKTISLLDWNDYVFQAEEEDIDITIVHTLVIKEEYLRKSFEIRLHPDEIEDEIEFAHLVEISSNKRRRSDI